MSEQHDLPPVAAPTNKISVNPIPLVRSESEVAGDFATGLMEGLIASGKAREAALVAVKDDHVIVAKGFGPDVLPSLDDEGNMLLALASGGTALNAGADYAEMHRNGWRALARDAEDERRQSRLVVVPEAKLAYSLVFVGKPGARLWRKADDALFDALLPPHSAADPVTASGTAPDLRDAEQAAGIYEPVTSRLSFLKTQGERLRVTARADGALTLTGAAEGVLLPRAGRSWTAENGNLSAVLGQDGLVLSTGAFRPLAFWKRPEVYAFFALLAAFSTAGAAVQARRSRRKGAVPGDLALGAGGLASVLLMLAALIWFLSPGA